jgi:uncharacterized repeat protein (TIGR03803 family)
MLRNPLISTLCKVFTLATFVLLSVSGTWAQSKFRVLHAFTGSGGDGGGLYGGLVFDASGNLYGGTSGGGTYGYGTVFELTPTAHGPWTESS